jgi:Zn-dependent protease with chaperone function
VLILAVLAPIFSQLIAMAVSREREYLADASSVEFTRNPRALLRALERIAQTESPLRHASRGIAHLFMVNPLEGAGDDGEGFFGQPALDASTVEQTHRASACADWRGADGRPIVESPSPPAPPP